MHNAAAAGGRVSALGAICALLFALVHFYWAAGGRIGVGDNAGAISDRPLFLAYDIAAGLVFAGVATGAALLAAGRGSVRLRSQLITAMLWGGAIALVRGVLLGLIPELADVGSIDVEALYDVVFAVGGAVFLLAALLLRSPRPAPTEIA